jgi:hypothetical protein
MSSSVDIPIRTYKTITDYAKQKILTYEFDAANVITLFSIMVDDKD